MAGPASGLMPRSRTEAPQYVNGAGPFLDQPFSARMPTQLSNPFTPNTGQMNVGQASHTGVPRIAYKLHIPNSYRTDECNFLQSEAIFTIIGDGTHTLTKPYSLRALNSLLIVQHEELLNLNVSKRKRGSGLGGLADTILTEDNFTRHVTFFGLVSDAASGGAAGSSNSNPGTVSRELAVHIKGRLDSANIWSGGTKENTSRQGDSVAFTVKRMNTMDDIPMMSGVTMNDYLKAIGPLQVEPIAGRKKGLYVSETFPANSSIERRLFAMSCAGDRVCFTKARPGEERKFEILETYDRLLTRNNIDNASISAYRRGTRFCTIPNLIEQIITYQRDPVNFDPDIVYMHGVVLECGEIKGVYSDPQPMELVTDAICDQREGPQILGGMARLNKTYTNMSHGHLLGPGIHLDVYRDQGMYHLPESMWDEIDGLEKVNEAIKKSKR